jgi:acetyltransferase-like isoleucine patch superfamily enzyme
MNKIWPNVKFGGEIGYGSYIAPNSVLLNCKIGRFTSIGSNVRIISTTHPYKSPFVSTSPAFFSILKQNGSTFANSQIFEEQRWADENKEFHVIIKSDCWIGDNVSIIGGVTIGNGAAVFANAVVTKDVPSYAVVAGVPAKIISYRYDLDTIDFLCKKKWWNKDAKWLKENWLLFSDMDKFQKKNE